MLFKKFLERVKFYVYKFYKNFNFFDKLGLSGLTYIKSALVILLIDCLGTDDEPIWEPLEWSLVQTWLLYIFLFSWVAETVITSNYGSFTGRDKRVYLGLYKAMWYTEMWFMVTIFVTCLFVIVPFYFEINYTLSSIVSWWDFFDSFFFFKIATISWIANSVSQVSKIGVKWLNWKKIFMLLSLTSFAILYMIYSQFIIFFFSYFTDNLTYKKTGYSDFNNLSNGPLKWGWGESDRDLFTYHATPKGFWFKNDGLYASSFFLVNFFIIFLLTIMYLQFLMIIRKVYSTKELSHTSINYGVSLVNQFCNCFYMLGLFIFSSYIYQFMRMPNDLCWFDKVYMLLESIVYHITNYLFL